jgi:hypothetical protein
MILSVLRGSNVSHEFRDYSYERLPRPVQVEIIDARFEYNLLWADKLTLPYLA